MAGAGFVTATVFLTKLTMPVETVELTSSLNNIKSTSESSPAGTLSVMPLPIVYVTVNVVFEGAWPYVLVYKKLDGSISISTPFLIVDNPLPTFVGFGIISSSLLSEIPAPNCNSNLLSLWHEL